MAPRWALAHNASRTCQPPLLASGFSWLARTLTKANSAATKKPLASTRPAMASASRVIPGNVFMDAATDRSENATTLDAPFRLTSAKTGNKLASGTGPPCLE